MYDIKDFNSFDLENDFDYYGDSEDFEEYDNGYIQDESFLDMWNNCIVLSSQSIIPLMWRLILSNICFSVIISSVRIPEYLYHLFSGLVGIYLVFEVVDFEGKCILCFYLIMAYLILVGTHVMHKHLSKAMGPIIKAAFIASLIISEHSLIEKEIFIRIRGILMILVMKILHLVDETSEKGEFPGFLPYFGYTLCGANILFGPWTSYQEYVDLYSKPCKKSVYWILGILRSLVLSLSCLSITNCLASYFISDSSNRWLLAYRDALAFRYSHYFVSYFAEMGMISAGYRNHSNEKLWSYTIANPLYVEFPTSLSTVVTKWNQPIHMFLKKTIYMPLKKYGQFSAIMATFLVSSFLHGLEIRVSVVLLSLGVYSYLQIKSRIVISDAMQACLNVKPCKNCTHKYRRDNLLVKFVLLVYSLASVLHLAYLGILMDPARSEVSIYDQWNDLYFVSHFIMIFNFLLII